jgi:hypothetical protein
MTEFGPGHIDKLRRGSSNVTVMVPGFAKAAINLDRRSVFVPTDPVKAAALAHLVKQASTRGMPTLRMAKGGIMKVDTDNIPADSMHKAIEAVTKTTKTKKVLPSSPNEPKVVVPVEKKRVSKLEQVVAPLEEKKTKLTKDTAPKIETYEMYPGVLNHSLYVWASAGGGKDEVFKENNWHHLGKSMRATVQGWRGLQNLVTELKAEYVIPSDMLRGLENIIALLKTSKNRSEKILPMKIGFIRNFWLDNARKPKNKEEIHPYVYFDEEGITVAVNIESCQAGRTLNRLAKVQFATKFTAHPPYLIKFFKNRAAVEKELQMLEAREIMPEDVRGFAKTLAKIPG